MPDPEDTASSWPGLFGQLNRTFDLIRDIFGYAMPGAVFLTIGLASRSYTVGDIERLLSPYTLRPWAAFIAVVTACYAAGIVMAATAYMPIGLIKYVVWMCYRHGRRPDSKARNESEVDVTNITGSQLSAGWKIIYPYETIRLQAAEASKFPPEKVVIDPVGGSWRDWLVNNPTEVTSRTLEMRRRDSKLFNTLDRRETLTLASGSMAAALLLGYYLFYHCPQWSLSEIIRWGGCIALIQFATGISHVRRVLQAISRTKPVPPDPDFKKLIEGLVSTANDTLKKYSGR
jgi:hypothetical protein